MRSPSLTYTSLFLFLILLTPSTSQNITLPASIEVDLIYPRANTTTHAVSSPFPVVFSVQNGPMAWEFGLNIHYSIYQINDSDPDDPFYFGSGSMEWSFPESSFNFPPGPPTSEPYLFASNDTEDIVPGTYTMAWSVERGQACSGSFLVSYTWDVEVANGTFEFDVAYGADEPDFEVSAPAEDEEEGAGCPMGLGGVVYSDYMTYVAYTDLQSMETMCQRTEGTLAALTPCAVTVDAAQASSLSDALSFRVISESPVTRTSSTVSYTSTSSSTSTSSTPTATDVDDAASGRIGIRFAIAVAIILCVDALF